jgi:hypothetical protein
LDKYLDQDDYKFIEEMILPPDSFVSCFLEHLNSCFRWTNVAIG